MQQQVVMMLDPGREEDDQSHAGTVEFESMLLKESRQLSRPFFSLTDIVAQNQMQ